MVRRYLQLLEFPDVDDDDIMELLPSPAANKRVCALYRELRDIESAPKALQGENMDLLDVRPRAGIVHSPDFESECVRVLRGKTHRLMRAKKTTLQPFEAARPADDAINAEEEDAPVSFVVRPRKCRRLAQDCVPYEQLKGIPPTSNVVERFFSVARVTFGHQRHGLLALTLETILFLRQNLSYWDATTVDNLR
ncbi:uncharacterized protein IUM83_09192 [Phytophthora cinnamomi]|uniref:uncharacterized protein n=1 Tax=Phytophthora cinnamomi TaxID=4785 RepID=UPI00355A6AD7|nr:hypothetical protein IUM83_09192 [Phytophthora cinnamomi]